MSTVKIYNGRMMQYRVNGFTGTDTIAAILYSPKRMAKRIAKKLLREDAPFSDIIPELSGTRLIVIMPDAPYRIVDSKGNVEVYEGKVTRVGL